MTLTISARLNTGWFHLSAVKTGSKTYSRTESPDLATNLCQNLRHYLGHVSGALLQWGVDLTVADR